MNKINILYLVSTLKKSGPINILYGIINGLDKQKFTVLIVTLSTEKSNSLKKEFQDMGCEIIDLHNSRLKGLLKNRKIIQRLVDQKNIQLCHSHGLRADIINSKLKNVITVNTVHNFPPEDYNHRYGKLMGSWLSIKHKNTIKQIQFPIACSKTVMEKFSAVFNIQIEFIQNGIDCEKFSPLKQDKNELRLSLDLPVDRQIFIVSGALSQLKNPGIIIKAFESKKNENHFLIFIGNGELFDSLSGSKHMSNIQFIGSVDNVNEYLQASDYYISASFTEGMPNSVLEAISTGLPVILSKISSHVEIIGDNYPYLFDPNSSQDLNKKIKLIQLEENKLFNQTRSLKIKNEFSAQLMSGKYQQLYLNSNNSSKK